jgi:periplasmic protein TonB
VVYYNVPVGGRRQPVWSISGMAEASLPVVNPRYPVSNRSLCERLPVAVSLLLHVAMLFAVGVWLRYVPPTAPAEVAVPVEVIFQVPADTAPALPQVSSPQAAPAPADRPPPLPPAEAPPLLAPVPPMPEALPPAPAAPIPEEAVAPAPPIQLPPQRPPPARLEPRTTAKTMPARPRAEAAPPAVRASPSAAAPHSAPPAETAVAQISADWQRALAAWLAAHKNYPEAARRRGEQGAVALRFSVERSGRVSDITVIEGSGFSSLDAAAENLLRGASVPAFPGAMTQDKITVTVRVRFTLTD